MIVTGDRVVEFVAREVGTSFYPPLTAIGEERDGEIVAGIVFNCWTGRDIELTVAIRRGAVSRRLLRCAAAYVFEQLGCARATFTTEHRAVVGLAKRLGAEPEGVKRELFGPGRDGVLLGLLKENWTVR